MVECKIPVTCFFCYTIAHSVQFCPGSKRAIRERACHSNPVHWRWRENGAEKGIPYAIDDDLGRKDTEGVVGNGQKRLELLTNWLND
jgi:hypothetical protein